MRSLVAAAAVACGLAASATSAWAQNDPAPTPPADPPPVPPDVAEPDAGGQSVIAPLDLAEPPTLVARVDQSQVALGEPFLLLITATYNSIPRGVNLPGSIELGGAFEALEHDWTDEVAPDGSQVRKFEINVIPWQVGQLLIPPVQLTYAIDGQAYAVHTEPVAIEVVSFVGDGAEVLRDIDGPVGLERRDWTLVYVAAGVLGTIVVLLAIYLVVGALRGRSPRARKRKGRPSIDTRLPHEIALDRITRLEQSGMLDDDDRKPAYVELSDILRGYLGRRYGFAALDMTTSEIKANVSRRANEIEQLCNRWLDDCDLVKFANYKPDIDEAHAALLRARDIIVASVPRPAPPTGATTPAPAPAPADAAMPAPMPADAAMPAPESMPAPAAEQPPEPAATSDEGSHA